MNVYLFIMSSWQKGQGMMILIKSVSSSEDTTQDMIKDYVVTNNILSLFKKINYKEVKFILMRIFYVSLLWYAITN